jgi:hypothetical protein
MIYTLILTVIHLFSKNDFINNINKQDIEQGLLEVDLGFDIIIPYCYSTQEQLDKLV